MAPRCRTTRRSRSPPARCSRIGAIEGPGQRAISPSRAASPRRSSSARAPPSRLASSAAMRPARCKAGDVLHLARRQQIGAARRRARAAHPRLGGRRRSTARTARRTSSSPSDIETLFATAYEVHFNCARTGVRLIGPAPKWARTDGGEAGLHPSNLHDNAYAIGAIDFTGDMPIILGPDGPSLGGFVCPAVIARDELWKMGQFKPGDTIRFHPVARPARSGRRAGGPSAAAEAGSAIVGPSRRWSGAGRLSPAGRRQPARRIRRHDRSTSRCACAFICCMEAVQKRPSMPGLIDLTPGIRSLQIHYDGTHAVAHAACSASSARSSRSLPAAEDVVVPSRIVHLPLSLERPARSQLAMRKYQELVRPNAPWCPDNIEFIRRINGLADIDGGQAHHLRRQLSRARPRRRLSRRPGRDADRSAPPAGHHQVQPGPHLDAGERRRHRRRLYVHLRHGRARAATSCSAAPSRSGTPGGRRRNSAGQAVAAPLLRPDPLLPGQP